MWRCAGTLVPSTKFTCSTDAVNAANLFASAGSSQRDIKPTTSTYLGACADRVEAAHASGALKSVAQERNRRVAESVEAASATGLPVCTTALSCSRETSSAVRADLLLYGLVAVVCPHAIPGLGCCVNMYTPEQHFYYDAVLPEVFKTRPDLDAIYLDLCCKYKPRLAHLLEELIHNGEIMSDQRAVKLLVPWMHAFDHDMQCQLQNSGLYQVRSTPSPFASALATATDAQHYGPRPSRSMQEGAARRVGEQTESLWSLIKPFAKRARYMTKAHYVDSMNLALYRLTLRKQRDMAKLLQFQWNENEKKIGECAPT